MPFLKNTRLNLPRSVAIDNKAKKSGLRGTIFAVNGDNYTGEWLDNRKHGWGTQEWKASGSLYNGEWKSGKQEGYGIFSILRQDTKTYMTQYCGEWKNGMKHGHGSFFDVHATYEGEWSEDNRSGWGRLTYKCGDLYEGEWLWDKEHGMGVIQFANGNWYEGSWRNGKKNGHGKFYYADKGIIYDGLWVDGDAKCGTLSDFGREEAPFPTKYPIPPVTLVNMQMVLSEAESVYVDDS
ncbi:MORN repeat-containing protein 3-like [Corythoichthys intestinalis]|uniref:MORN repeat-containing protein 3-like n=1 Tax=Corythoichthys intestinalis TaxID=161448 RepID=UPI0025A643CA|nr:MORN repeat-containing protein 3-like [Corythoichthys intestinalis]XP_061809886.1 MORN repeat-containing protein 3-like [Nerophis lumbriciformis]